jgi:hypothetical protein
VVPRVGVPSAPPSSPVAALPKVRGIAAARPLDMELPHE